MNSLTIHETMSTNEETSLDVETITINPKVDDDPLPLTCPDCIEAIQGVVTSHGLEVEYRCGCDELRKFELQEAPGGPNR